MVSAFCYGIVYSVCISVLIVLDSPGGLGGGRKDGMWLVDWLVGRCIGVCEVSALELHWGGWVVDWGVGVGVGSGYRDGKVIEPLYLLVDMGLWMWNCGLWMWIVDYGLWIVG